VIGRDVWGEREHDSANFLQKKMRLLFNRINLLNWKRSIDRGRDEGDSNWKISKIDNSPSLVECS
jgi:hypothetical protein